MFSSRPLSPEDSPLVLQWRNSPEVAAFMFNDDPIDENEHAAWFDEVIEDRPRSRARLFTVNDAPTGFFSLTQITDRHKSCVWGGYLSPEAPRGRRLGSAMMSVSLAMAFDEIGLHRVTVEVIESNSRAMGLYEGAGFQREGMLRDRARQARGYVNVIVLGLLREDWR